jgi:lathosterol oxidase
MKQAIELFVKIFSVSAVRYFLLAGVPFLLYYKLAGKKYSRNKIQNRNAGNKDFKRDILHSLQTTAIFTVIGIIVLYTPFKNITRSYTLITDYPIWWIPVSLVLSLIVHDTYFYWMHRLLHYKKLFPYTHVLHHQSTNPSPWTSYSFHFFEACTEGAVLLIIVTIIPMHFITVLLFIVVGFIINVYGHLGYEIAPRWFRHSVFFELLNSSVYHNLHHSKFKGNYGLYFRIWDRLLGTEHPDYVKEYDRIQQNRYGEKALS